MDPLRVELPLSSAKSENLLESEVFSLGLLMDLIGGSYEDADFESYSFAVRMLVLLAPVLSLSTLVSRLLALLM